MCINIMIMIIYNIKIKLVIIIIIIIIFLFWIFFFFLYIFQKVVCFVRLTLLTSCDASFFFFYFQIKNILNKDDINRNFFLFI